MNWFFTARNGDHRLEVVSDDKCKLIIQDASLAEQAHLQKFLALAAKKKWIEGKAGGSGTAGEIANNLEIAISAPMKKVGPALMRILKPGKAVVTAIKYAGGKVTCVEASQDASAIEGALEKPIAEAAATVRRPRLSCPSCTERVEDRRAERVLSAFLAPNQLEQWQREHRFRVFGGTTGHCYEIVHRYSRLAQERKRIVFDLDDHFVLHCYDWSVPPAEEALGAALLLAHKESWVRNEASCWDGTGHARNILKNPFGDIFDGADEDGLNIMAAAGTVALLGSI